MLNISNIPGITEVKPKMRIVGKIDIEEYSASANDMEDSNLPKEMNKHLEKYMKSTGGKGPMPPTLDKEVSEFKRKLLYDNK